MGDSAVADETTSLLQHHDEDGATTLERRRSYTSSLRRMSSSGNLPPYHEQSVPDVDEEPASAATIWTIVPVSLLGRSSQPSYFI